jgi:hypothetical protein
MATRSETALNHFIIINAEITFSALDVTIWVVCMMSCDTIIATALNNMLNFRPSYDTSVLELMLISSSLMRVNVIDETHFCFFVRVNKQSIILGQMYAFT